jgi:hypothetical protein
MNRKKKAVLHKSKAEPSTAEQNRLTWSCPGCHRAVSTEYCPACGEGRLRPRDLTLRGFADQAALVFVSVDGPLLRSYRYVATRPGFLTTAYLTGHRKPYQLPLQLFLVANVLFFALQSVVGAKVLSTSLQMHLHNQVWSSIAQQLVDARLAKTGTTLELYTPVFNQAVEVNAKAWIILMVVPLTLLLPAMFRRKRIPFVGHIVFSLHFYSFLLLLFCVALLVVGGNSLAGGPGLGSEAFDHGLSSAEVAICAVYLFAAIGAVYGERGVSRVLKTGLLITAVASIFLGYRFVVMLITLYTT